MATCTSQPNPTVENSIVIWLDTNINPRSSDYKPLLIQLRQLIHTVLPFKDPDQCLDYLSDIKHEKIFLIISGELSQHTIPVLRQFDQINSIYIYCHNRGTHEKWTKHEKLIKGVFTKIEPIYDALRRDFRQCEDDLCSFSILSPTDDKFNPSNRVFIYTQLLKDILIQMNYQPKDKLDFINACQSVYQDNHYQLKIIEEFRQNYRPSKAIQWYTRECFISSMLNKAFRIRDLSILIPMGFFIRDLHQELVRLSSKQNNLNNLTIYRGQGITEKQFQTILDNQNGFLSFNNFLITTIDKNLSLTYARFSRDHHQLIGVVFQMEIDRINSIFISLNQLNYYSESQNEILLTTQTMFRIHDVHQIEDGLWEIKLKLTNDETDQLGIIQNLIEQEKKGENGGEQLTALMNTLHGFESSTTEITNEQIESQTTEKANEQFVENDERHEDIELPLANIEIEQEQQHEEEVETQMIVVIRGGNTHLSSIDLYFLLPMADQGEE